MDRQTLCFAAAMFPDDKTIPVSKHSHGTRRIWARLAAPVAAHSGENQKGFLCTLITSIYISTMERTHVMSLIQGLCKFNSELVYEWIAKPFVPLQIVDKP